MGFHLRKSLRFSIRSLLLLVALVALGLTVIIQHWQHRDEQLCLRAELRELRDKLYAAEQTLEKLPAGNPNEAAVLATPSFAYGRWAWRVYLPPGHRYALRIAVGTAVEKDNTRIITPAKGHSQQMGLRGDGETTVIVKRILADQKFPILGVAIGKQEVPCRLTQEVDRCMAGRSDYQEEQTGTAGAEHFAPDETIPLLLRWYHPFRHVQGRFNQRSSRFFCLARTLLMYSDLPRLISTETGPSYLQISLLQMSQITYAETETDCLCCVAVELQGKNPRGF